MAGEPISKLVFSVKLDALKDIETLAAVDRGCSLTKIVYVPKSQPTSETGDYLLTCLLFLNANFEAALQWLKREALLPEKGKINVTGVGCVKWKSLITETLGLEVVIIDEFVSQCRGTHFLIKNVDDQDLCYPPPEVVAIEMEHSEIMQTMREKYKEKFSHVTEGASKKFPCLFAFLGSGAAIVSIEEDGKFKMNGWIALAGKSFLGLSRCMVGTKDYDEILDLAAKGDRKNVDTQVWEVLVNDGNSPYGRFPPELPIFGFGKAADNNIGLETFKTADVARSLVAICGGNILHSVVQVSMLLQYTTIYLGGNMLRGETFRQEIAQAAALWRMDHLKINFLKTGHTAAIGAMITTPGDEAKYFSV